MYQTECMCYSPPLYCLLNTVATTCSRYRKQLTMYMLAVTAFAPSMDRYMLHVLDHAQREGPAFLDKGYFKSSVEHFGNTVII